MNTHGPLEPMMPDFRQLFAEESTSRVQQESDGRIRVRSGRLVDPWNLKPGDITVDDIAFSLSNETRYSGHVGDYTVGQHSVLLVEYFFDPWDKLAALFHDGEEAYLKDVPSPVKKRPEMAAYREACGRARKVIFDTVLGPGVYEELYPRVKPFDDRMYSRERDSFAGKFDRFHPGYIRFWPHEYTYRQFLLTFHHCAVEAGLKTWP